MVHHSMQPACGTISFSIYPMPVGRVYPAGSLCLPTSEGVSSHAVQPGAALVTQFQSVLVGLRFKRKNMIVRLVDAVVLVAQ